MLHIRSSSVITKSPATIDHDIHKRLFCCILIDGDAHIIIQMNFSTLYNDTKQRFKTVNCKSWDQPAWHKIVYLSKQREKVSGRGLTDD